jgi:tetratricopeptide (TPR) repeat protein
MVRVREQLTLALGCDPGFSKAHSKMSWSYLVDAYYGWAADHDATMETARQWAVRALASDDGDSWSHWAFAAWHMLSSSHAVALEAFRRALDCNPNDAEVMMDYALCLSYAGRAEEAIAQAQRAMRLNPHHHDWYRLQLGQIRFDARQYDKAIAAFASLRTLDCAIMRLYQAASLAAAGNPPEAAISVRRALDLDPGATLEKWTGPRLAPYAMADARDHLRENLRRAGLPERAAPRADGTMGTPPRDAAS